MEFEPTGGSSVIGAHCGVRLRYEWGRFKDPKLDYHQWYCVVCGRRFKQRVRVRGA